MHVCVVKISVTRILISNPVLNDSLIIHANVLSATSHKIPTS